jgi:hypothetical protein
MMQSATADPISPSVAPLVRSGALVFAARALLLASVAFSLLWVPIIRIGSWTVAASDTALLGLWAITGFDLLTRGVRSLDGRTPSIALLAIAIALLAFIGAELNLSEGPRFLEIALFMKRFGLAAIIPLAATRFRSPSIAAWTRFITAVATAALTAFSLWPELATSLPRPDSFEGINTDRAVGLGTDPNDLAYVAFATLILHGAFLPRPARIWDLLLLFAVLVGAAFCIVTSGSRSGLLGSTGALLYVLARSRIRPRVKIVLLGSFVAMLFLGLSASVVFSERVNRAYKSGIHEENLFARIEAQQTALRASLHYPFGVGFRNIRWATERAQAKFAILTTDNVYLDTLLGAGFPGLMALLLLFKASWKHVGSSGGGSQSTSIFRAGIVAFLIFGLATVVPFSVFLAPLFFSIVSGASHVRDR